MAKQKQETWYNLFNNFGGYDFEEYKKDYEENNECEVSDECVWDYISELERMDWEDMLNILAKCEKQAYGWVIEGTAGTWRGKIPAMRKFDNAEKMICEITRHCDYVKVECSTNGGLRVTAAHHDGTHCFNCKLLNYNGRNTYDEWYIGEKYNKLSEYQMLEKLYNSNFYTRLPRIDW